MSSPHFNPDPSAQRHSRFRIMQFAMLGLMGFFFFLAAIALPVFQSPLLGWVFLALLVAALYGFWWSGRQADRRGHRDHPFPPPGDMQ